MQIILYPFMIAAGIGFALSVMAHLLALAGIEPPGGSLVWDLHAGIFVVWIPAVIVSMRTTRFSGRKDFWKVALSGCPVWMRRVFYVIFAYAIINFILFAITAANEPRPHGEASASMIRGFSGHWMAFYSAAFAILYSAIHAPYLFQDRKCRNGHVVDPAAHFCPACGEALP